MRLRPARSENTSFGGLEGVDKGRYCSNMHQSLRQEHSCHADEPFCRQGAFSKQIASTARSPFFVGCLRRCVARIPAVGR